MSDNIRSRRVVEYLMPLPANHGALSRLMRRIEHDYGTMPSSRIKVDISTDSPGKVELIIRVPIDWVDEDAHRAKVNAETPDRYADV